MFKSTELLHKIDKASGITVERVDTLTKSINEDKKSGGEWRTRIEKAVKECPEAQHIKEQNGKIGDIQLTMRATKLLVKLILFIVTVGTIYISVMQYVNSDTPSNKVNKVQEGK